MSLRISDGHLKFLPLYTVFVYVFEFEHQENLSLIIMSLATKPEAFQVQEQPKVIPFIDQVKGGRAGHSFLKEALQVFLPFRVFLGYDYEKLLMRRRR